MASRGNAIEPPSLPRMADGFRLVRELGRGGMGVVYEAEEIASGRSVALKVLVGDLDLSDEALERFRREARIAASISDSRCVFVFGAHQVEGSPAIAMELCRGETLEHRLAKKERIPIETAVRWTLEILEGLEAAHAVGIVHRDVKPSNCFITGEGHVKVGDFGLSRSLEGDVRLTQSGAFLGSPLYASPEQVRGREVSLESDIYSCGATLYALLTGRPPYYGQNIGEVLARILSEPPPPPRSLRAEIPAGLERVVLRAMDKDPSRRFRDHASFRAALAPFLSSEAVAGSPSRRFVAYAIDFLLSGQLKGALTFACTTGGLGWARLDLARPWHHESSSFLLVMGAIPALYFALFEGLLGATPAKWAVGLRVVSTGTRQVALGRAALRAVVFFGPFLVLEATLNELALSQIVHGVVLQGGILVLHLALLSSMRRRNGYRLAHEFASGTRTIQAPPFGLTTKKRQRPVPALGLQPAGAWPREVGPYVIEGVLGPTPSGTVLLALDRELGRQVWIVSSAPGTTAANEERRGLARPGRLRWLAHLDDGGASYAVFEAPGGTSLCALAATGEPLEWPVVHRLLAGLAEELARVEELRESAESARVSMEQVWVDRAWNARVLDQPLGAGPFSAKAPPELLADAAALLLASRPGQPAPLAEVPLSADAAVGALTGKRTPFADARRASAALAELAATRVSFSTRALQMAVAAIMPCLMLGGTALVLFFLRAPMAQHAERLRWIREVAAQETGAGAAMDADDRRAREILIADESDNPTSRIFMNNAKPLEQDLFRRALEAHPRPSAEDLAWARERTQLHPYPLEEKRVPDTFDIKMVPILLALTVFVWGLASSLFAFLFGGGLTFKVFGLGLRTSRGAIASRWRCLARSTLLWVPPTAGYAAAAGLVIGAENVPAGTALALATLVAQACVAVYALTHPTRGLQDRLAGTRLVPR